MEACRNTLLAWICLTFAACHHPNASATSVGAVGPAVLITGVPVPAGSGLPPLPQMSHVQARVRGNSATISFDPVPGAVDYRVYAMPAKADIRLTADGSLDGINNATFRCAGVRAAPPVAVDFDPGPPPNPVPSWIAVNTLVDGNDVFGYTRRISEATLGYAFPDSAADAVPVFAVGDPAANADNYGYGIREPQTRAKLYVTEKTSLVASGWRDDGAVFYAPTSASSKACGSDIPLAVQTADLPDHDGVDHLYFTGAEAASRGAGTTAFFLCPKQAPGTVPVMRVHYLISSAGGDFGGSGGHDELVLGKERFTRARCQGSRFGPCAGASPAAWEVHWSNLTAPTELIVEALDAGCPFQGLLGPNALPATLVDPDDNNGNTGLLTDPFFIFQQLQTAAPHGELYVNAQFDGSPTPHPIARMSMNVAPQQREKMDFASDSAGAPETFAEMLAPDGTPDCGLTAQLQSLSGNPDGCDTGHRLQSPTYDVLMMDMRDQRYTLGPLLGTLGTAYSGGKFRISPKATAASATLSDSGFLHVAMEVSAFTTGRRYPQIIVSQQDFITATWLLERTAPGAINTNVAPAIFVHPIDAAVGRPVLELEMCTHRLWQVNNHCPWFLLERGDPPSPDKPGKNNAHPDLFDRLQDDSGLRLDLFLSTQKAYVFLDSMPYGCADLGHRRTTSASGAPINPLPVPPPAGPVTVAFGDVLYHPGAEAGYFEIYSAFHLSHLMQETQRHFDYLAFSSNVPAPPWDEQASPCATQMFQGGDAGAQTPEQGD